MQWLTDLIIKLFDALLNRPSASVVEAEKAGAAQALLATETQTDDNVEKALQAAAAARAVRPAVDGVRHPAAPADPDCRDCQA